MSHEQIQKLLLDVSLVTKSAVKSKQQDFPFKKKKKEKKKEKTPTVYYFNYKCERNAEDRPRRWCVWSKQVKHPGAWWTKNVWGKTEICLPTTSNCLRNEIFRRQDSLSR